MRYQNALDSCFFLSSSSIPPILYVPKQIRAIMLQICVWIHFDSFATPAKNTMRKQRTAPVSSRKKSDSCLFNCLAFFRIIKRKNVYQTSNTVLNGQREIPFDSCFTLFHLLDLLVANLSLVFNISAHFSFTSSSELKSKRPTTTTKMYKTTR